MEMPMIRRNRDVSRPNFNQTNPKCANRRASYLKTNLARAFRATAPALFALTFASVAHAQGTMDFSGAQTLMGTFNSRFAYVSVSRAAQDAQLYTDSAASLASSLSHAVTKSSALSTEQTMAASLSM
jgi:hypothetical protein